MPPFRLSSTSTNRASRAASRSISRPSSAASLGTDVVVTLKPWTQTEADFRAGRVDVIAMVDTAARRQWARFAKAHATLAFGIYRLRTRPAPQAPQDLAGLRIAVRDTDTMRATIDTLLAGLTATYVPFAEAGRALAAVQRGEADIALLPRDFADRHLGTDLAPDVVAGSRALPLQSYAFAVAPHDEALQRRLQRGLEQLEGSGRLEALRVKWLSSHHNVAERKRLEQEVAREQLRAWGVGGVSTLALVAMGGAAWVRGRRYVAERKRRHHAEAMLERAFTANPEPMLIVERASGTVRDANAAVLRLLGIPADGAADRPLRTLAEHLEEDTLARLASALDRQGSLDAVPLRLPRPDGSERACLVSAEPLDSFRDERGTWYRVADNGAGFDMAHARSLFLPFRRMHTDAQFPGTGVGLSVVRRIVDRHGGEIRLHSSPGVGTVAEFTLEPAPARDA